MVESIYLDRSVRLRRRCWPWLSSRVSMLLARLPSGESKSLGRQEVIGLLVGVGHLSQTFPGEQRQVQVSSGRRSAVGIASCHRES